MQYRRESIFFPLRYTILPKWWDFLSAQRWHMRARFWTTALRVYVSKHVLRENENFGRRYKRLQVDHVAPRLELHWLNLFVFCLGVCTRTLRFGSSIERFHSIRSWARSLHALIRNSKGKLHIEPIFTASNQREPFSLPLSFPFPSDPQALIELNEKTENSSFGSCDLFSALMPRPMYT